VGKILRGLGREIKLGFKTVTYNFKQYICFFIAILAMQVMFGIIVMSSSNNIYQHEKKTIEDYGDSTSGYHFAMTNLPKDVVKYYDKLDIEHLGYYITTDDNFVYVYIDTETEEGIASKSLEQYFKEFKTKHASKMNNYIKTEDIIFEFSPLYELEDTVLSMRLECAVKLLVLALVSIAVIILLFNIRLNHFKFTYGIYMSFGADTRKLFSTSFWEMMVIGLLTVIPAGVIATFTDYYFYVSGDYKYRFAPWLMAYALIFIIPVLIISVFVPVKITASKPPLKLLLAEDNSNLVSSPRYSTQLFGKKFPHSYEMLGLWRFRKYCATLVASSVLFASIFVWITFFKDIYSFTNEQDRAEFTVNNKYEVKEITEYVSPTDEEIDKYSLNETNALKKARNKLYKYEIGDINIEQYMKYVADYEKYFIGDYKIERAPNGVKVTAVYDANGTDVWDEFVTARENIVKPDYIEALTGGKDQTSLKSFQEHEKYLDKEKYVITVDPSGYVSNVIAKIKVEKELEIFGEILPSYRDELDNIVSDYGHTYKQCVSDESSNYAYLALKLDNVRAFSGYEVNLKNRTERITPRVDYFALDDEGDVINYLQKNYDIDGDVMDINDGGKVIISETAANRKVLKIKPGDTIEIRVRRGNKVTSKATSPEDYLADLIREGEEFETYTFTVAAVVKNMPTATNLPIFLSEKDFTEITGSKVQYNQISVYVAPTISGVEISALHSELVEWADDFATVKWNDAVSESREKAEHRNIPVIQMIALFALILSPLFWFFSQIMFFGKREEEFSMLRGMGATEKEIKRIFSKDGLVLAGLGVLATVIFSLIGVFAIHKINMAFVARLDTDARVLYKLNYGLFVQNLSGEEIINPLWIALAIAVVFTAICGYFSSMIPYLIDRKKAKKAISKEFGE